MLFIKNLVAILKLFFSKKEQGKPAVHIKGNNGCTINYYAAPGKEKG